MVAPVEGRAEDGEPMMMNNVMTTFRILGGWQGIAAVLLMYERGLRSIIVNRKREQEIFLRSDFCISVPAQDFTTTPSYSSATDLRDQICVPLASKRQTKCNALELINHLSNQALNLGPPEASQQAVSFSQSFAP